MHRAPHLVSLWTAVLPACCAETSALFETTTDPSFSSTSALIGRAACKRVVAGRRSFVVGEIAARLVGNAHD